MASNGRRKTRTACEHCKRMKRKCNGRLPCDSCVRYDYKCAYGGRSGVSDQKPGFPTDLTKPQAKVKPITSISQSGYLIEPSTASFTRDLLRPLESDQDVTRMRGDSWNIGMRRVTVEPPSLSKLVSLDEANGYASIYFSKINPVYELLDSKQFTSYLTGALMKDDSLNAPYTAVVCYIIALGSLFSGMNGVGHSNCARAEPEIVRFGHIQLERCRVGSQSDFVVVAATGWLLRALYTRMAADRHNAWFASFSALTLLENIQTHSNESGEQMMVNCCHSEHPDHAKLHRLARLLNLWIGNELDSVLRRSVILSLPCTIPDKTLSRTFSALLSLYEISVRLCSLPMPCSLSILSTILADLDHQNSLMPINDVLQLHVSTHALCTYRMMRQTKALIPSTTTSDVIRIATPGIAGALRLARDQQPWWHVVHVPFQFLCVSLTMDTRESLARTRSVMECLREIHKALPTRNMGEIVETAEGLVAMCQRSKIEEVRALGGERIGSLEQPQNAQELLQQQEHAVFHTQNLNEANLVAAGGGGGVVGECDILGASADFDWDAFMQSCMPLFEDGFPDYMLS